MAPLIREAYELYALGVYSLEEVRRQVMKRGFKISKQQFYNMMRAVVYTGRSNVFACEVFLNAPSAGINCQGVVPRAVPEKSTTTIIVKRVVRNDFGLIWPINLSRSIWAVQINPAVLELYKAVLTDLFNNRLSDQGTNISKLETERSKFVQLKSNAEDRFFANEIDRPTFMNVSSRYENKIIQINGRISDYLRSQSCITIIYEYQ